MNELAVASTQPSVVSPFSGPAAFEAAQRIAKALGSSSMLPDIYRGPENLGNVLILLEMTQRIGCSLMTIAQNLHVIHGRPSFSSSFLIGSVNASGRFTPLRFEFSGAIGTDLRGCRAKAQDKASGEVCEGTIVTVAMAKSQGWWQKTGSKWPSMTEQMLTYRAAAFWVRIYCPELALGMHTVDELEDTGGRSEPAKPMIQRVTPEPTEVVPEPIAVVPDPPSYPTEPAIAPPDMEALRAQITGEFKAQGISWKEVQSLAARDKWWDDADSLPFKSLPFEALQYLSTRVERIARTLKAPLTPAAAEPTLNQ